MSSTLWQRVERRAEDAPAAASVLFENTRITNREFRDRALRLAGGLRNRGVERGDVVAVQLPNIPEYLLSYAAICALGATLQPVHMPYRRAELSHLLAHSGAQVFICAAPPEGVEGIKRVIPLGASFSALEDSGKIARAAAGSRDERFLLLYTSGTTDNPKGVPHAQRGFLGNAQASVSELEITPDEIILCAGWFETGDTAEISAAGHLRFTGRVKEIINRGGVKYSPLSGRSAWR